MVELPPDRPVPAHARGERQKLWKIYLNLTSSRTREGGARCLGNFGKIFPKCRASEGGAGDFNIFQQFLARYSLKRRS